MFKLRPVTFHSPLLWSGDISISSTQIWCRGGGFAISLLSFSLRWRCGVVVVGFIVGALDFCGFWFVFLVLGLLWGGQYCWWVYGFCWWLMVLWVLLVVGGWWSLAFCGICWVRSLALWVLFFNFFLLLWIRERKERRLKRGVREKTEGT